jgi:hypothetical protein
LAIGKIPVTPVVKDMFVTVLFDPFMVLLVRVSEPAKVARVPVVGSVTPVAPETVNVVAKDPEIVSVLAALFATPVPPLTADKAPEIVLLPKAMVLLVRVSEPAKVAKVPVVGKVTLVAAVRVLV